MRSTRCRPMKGTPRCAGRPRHGGWVLDRVYTAKAFAGLLAQADGGPLGRATTTSCSGTPAVSRPCSPPAGHPEQLGGALPGRLGLSRRTVSGCRVGPSRSATRSTPAGCRTAMTSCLTAMPAFSARSGRASADEDQRSARSRRAAPIASPSARPRSPRRCGQADEQHAIPPERPLAQVVALVLGHQEPEQRRGPRRWPARSATPGGDGPAAAAQGSAQEPARRACPSNATAGRRRAPRSGPPALGRREGSALPRAPAVPSRPRVSGSRRPPGRGSRSGRRRPPLRPTVRPRARRAVRA